MNATRTFSNVFVAEVNRITDTWPPHRLTA